RRRLRSLAVERSGAARRGDVRRPVGASGARHGRGTCGRADPARRTRRVGGRRRRARARRRTHDLVRKRRLVSPPAAPAVDVGPWILAEVRRADDEELEPLGPGLIASPHTGRDADGVPFLELDDLVVDLHPPAPAHHDVHLLLRLVGVAVREAIARRDALVAQRGVLELERLRRGAELEVRRTVELRAEVFQILPDVRERVGHGAILCALSILATWTTKAARRSARAAA